MTPEEEFKQQKEAFEKHQRAAEERMKELWTKPLMKLVGQITLLEKCMGVLHRQTRINSELAERDIFPELQVVASACEENGLFERLIVSLDRLNENLEKPAAGSFLSELAGILKK